MNSWIGWMVLIVCFGSCTAPPTSTEYRNLLFVRQSIGLSKDSIWVNLQVDHLGDSTVYRYSTDSTQPPLLRNKRLTYFADGRLYMDRMLLEPAGQWGEGAALLLTYEWPGLGYCASAQLVFSPTYGVLQSDFWHSRGGSTLELSSHVDSVALRALFPMESDSSLMRHLGLAPLPPSPPLGDAVGED